MTGLSETERSVRALTAEGLRYLLASAAALGVDFSLYIALIRIGGVHYLAAAPLAFSAGLALVYALSVRWVFRHRAVADRRMEFAVFAAIGLGGMALNELLLYLAVEVFALSYAGAKLVSAAIVFCFNFAARKLILFSRR
jgi:putative flippase GtrA